MRLYLDIDGVVLGKRDPTSSEVCLAHGAPDLLQLALDIFDPWWLTTHSDGEIAPIVRYLTPHCDDEVMTLVRRIPAAAFRTLKTEALVGTDFLWLDDAPLFVERQWLADRGLLDKWIEVNTRRRPHDLDRVLPILRARAMPAR
jgi:hypothetical protein